MGSALDKLHNRLSDSLGAPPDTFSGPARMAEAAEWIAALFADAVPQEIDIERLTKVVRALGRGEELGVSDLRLCCTGATTAVILDRQPFRVVDDDTLTSRLLIQAARHKSSPRVWRRCAFGLAHAYLLPDERPDGPARTNLGRLAKYVTDYARNGATDTRALLVELQDVFAEGSTRRFWPAVLDNNVSVLMPLERLGTPSTSWIWRQIVVDAIDEWATWENRTKTLLHVDAILVALRLQPLLLDRGMGMMLRRLARLRGVPDQPELREETVTRWHSPLVAKNHPTWMRWADDASRRLVVSWLTRRVLESFFGSMAGGSADPRRAAFWRQYANHIDELWVFLGEETRLRRGPELVELRRALGPTVKRMEDPVTNAFVMFIGDCAYVEFSTTGHALYAYERDRLPFRLERAVAPRTSDFRDKARSIDWLTHQGAWEERFRASVGEHTGAWPAR